MNNRVNVTTFEALSFVKLKNLMTKSKISDNSHERFARSQNQSSNLNQAEADLKNVTMEAEIDCYNKTCFLTKIFQARCAVYIGQPPLCEIPCKLEGCKIEFHQNMICSIWSCHEKSTTTMMPIPTPTPIPSSNSVENGLVASVFFNVLFLLGFSLVVGKYLRKRQQSTQALDDDVIAHNEEIIDIIRNSTPIFRRVDQPGSSQGGRQSTGAHDQRGSSQGGHTGADDRGSSQGARTRTQATSEAENLEPNFIASAPPDPDAASASPNESSSSTTARSGSLNELSTKKLKDAKKRFAKFWKKQRSTNDDVESQT